MAPHFIEAKTGTILKWSNHATDKDPEAHAWAQHQSKTYGTTFEEVGDKDGPPCTKYPHKYQNGKAIE